MINIQMRKVKLRKEDKRNKNNTKNVKVQNI